MITATWDSGDDELTAESGEVDVLEEDDVTTVAGDDDNTGVWDDDDEVTRVADLPKLGATLRSKTHPARPQARAETLPPPPLPPPSRFPPPSRVSSSRPPASATRGRTGPAAPPPSSRAPTSLKRPTAPPPPRPPKKSTPPPPAPLPSRRVNSAPPPYASGSAPPPMYIPPSLPPRGRAQEDSIDRLLGPAPSRRAPAADPLRTLPPTTRRPPPPSVPPPPSRPAPGPRDQALVLDALGAARSAPAVVPLSAPAASALSVPPVMRTPAPTPARRRRGRGLLSAMVLMLGLTAAAAVLAPKSLLELATQRVPAVKKLIDLRTQLGIPDWIGAKLRGSLIITAKGPNDSPVKGAKVFLDGSLRCEEVPCRLDDLKNGSHIVRVSADGFEATADRAIVVDGESAFDVALTPQKSAAPPPEPVAVAKPPATGTAEPPAAPSAMIDADQPLSDTDIAPASPAANRAPAGRTKPALAAALRPAGQAAAAKEKPQAAAASEDPAADEKGVIRLSSTPPANVVVDGRPIGMTPKAVRVKPGSHTVVFAAGTERNVQSVNVKPGATVSVGAKF